MTNSILTDSMSLLLIVLATGFAHACFQLAVSVLTMLNSHTIGRHASQAKMLSLNSAYILGSFLTVSLLTLAVVTLIESLPALGETTSWIVLSSLLVLVGIFVGLFYYRRGKGTTLWLPRAFSQYLLSRTKKTTHGVEAFGLGIISVIAELPFIIAPLAVIGYVIHLEPTEWWLGLSSIYGAIVCLPLLFVMGYLSSGHKMSVIQSWRERNKTFLQWTSSIVLILLACYLTSMHVWGMSA